MLNLKRKKGPFQHTRKWFAVESASSDCFRFVSYLQFQGEQPPRGLLRKEFHTQLIDLTKSEELLLQSMKKNTCYEIRRADKDGVAFTEETDLEKFRKFYNLFAHIKSLPALHAHHLASIGSALRVTRAEIAHETLVMHAYLADPESSRARLFLSASAIGGSDKSLCGRANRGLHWYDMKFFKIRDYAVYDMGGIAMGNGNDSTRGIDHFKTGFGGTTVREDHFHSPLAALVASLMGKRL